MKRYGYILLSLIVLALVAAVGSPALAQWSTNVFENNPVDSQPEDMMGIQSAPDGSGGLIVVYVQSPGSPDSTDDVWAQRMDSNGMPVWPAPVLVQDIVAPDQIYADQLRVISDNNGGAYIALTISAGGISQISLRSVSGSGIVDAATTVTDPTGFNQLYPELILDNDEGVILAWSDERNAGSSSDDIWAQKFEQGGIDRVWADEGIPVCQAVDSQLDLTLISDNDYGCYVAWTDWRYSHLPVVYMQRILESGMPAWTVDGQYAINWPYGNQNPTLIEGGPLGGFLLAGQYQTVGADLQIRVGRYSEDGSLLWNRAIAEFDGSFQFNSEMISDGQGGAFVAWSDRRSNGYTGDKVVVQAVTQGGALRWDATGVVCGLADVTAQDDYHLVADGFGGVVVVWQDDRSVVASDVYGQRISNDGDLAWDAAGLPISMANTSSYNLSAHSDGQGGLLAIWRDSRQGSQHDGFVQRVDFHGKLGEAKPQITGVVDFPQDQGGVVRLDWARSYLDDFSFADISEYTIWRRYGGAGKALAIEGSQLELEIDRLAARTELAPAFVANQLLAGWSLLDQVDAYHWDEYAYDAATFADSTGSGIILTDFKVVAHQDPLVYWESDVVAGYSVDNLAPGMPQLLTADYLSPDGVLEWSPAAVEVPDLAGYLVYRSDIPGFSPDSGSFVGTTADTSFVDVGLPAGSWHYLVTAEDVNGNEGLPSNEAQLQTGVSAVGEATPEVFRLTGAAPNPFNPTTTLHFSLARAGETTVQVFDTRGRLVKRLLSQSLAAGSHTLVWDGRNEQDRGMPSGVYFAQLTSGTEYGVMKLLLAK